LEDIEVQDRLDEVGRRRLSELELSLPAPDQVPRAELYAGKDGCIGCHAEQHAHWSLTAHAGAWRTLVERGENENPNCLGCHTTGFGEPGGFADPTTDRALLNVQCEACHGPMALHAEQHAGRLGFKPDPGLAVTERTCLRCHDPANSPKFAFETFYPKVVHPGLRP
jgi:hypothetical protein